MCASPFQDWKDGIVDTGFIVKHAEELAVVSDACSMLIKAHHCKALHIMGQLSTAQRSTEPKVEGSGFLLLEFGSRAYLHLPLTAMNPPSAPPCVNHSSVNSITSPAPPLSLPRSYCV